jgi:hypothetical protein
MRRIDGHFECTLCSALLEIGDDARPQVMLMTVSGGRAERVVVADGCAVHRCPVVEPAAGRAGVRARTTGAAAPAGTRRGRRNSVTRLTPVGQWPCPGELERRRPR